ncbi:NUDIX domain-containing protein [Pseudomonas sp. GD03860]|uniref:NUDIX hydrolase n=1 Tax=Pseudomonas TaxID=286 RepID=UPI002363A1DE|nr:MULTISPECIES: NUDIX domain-containing protein [Pseudomonas]MDD2056872.1 NUDIX domain-containing protein [Pseudomonas putida]MDH0637928.1 NUDIX domain-containing protein [Pseudomonas sp. GD03860]
MRERKSARLLVINPSQQVLLFKFVHTDDALAGSEHWATPGGGLEEGETFQAAAIRELREETGIQVTAVADAVAERRFEMMLPSGEWVFSVEQYFVVHVENQALSRADWTEHEVKVMAEHHWWSVEELRATQQTVWPQRLIEMLCSAVSA